MSSIGQRTRSSRGSKRDTGTSSSMPERQEERVLSSAQLTLVKAQARRIAREELSAATGIGELVRQMVEDEVSALRSSGKLIPDRAQAAQVSKIVDDLQAVEVARQKREGDVQTRLTELERRGTDASPSGSWNKVLSDANRRIEVLEVSLGSLLEDGGRVTSTAEAGALNERLRVLEAKVESLTPLSERVNKALARLDKLEKTQQSLNSEVGRLLDNMQPLPLRLDQQTENIQSLTNSIENLQSQMKSCKGNKSCCCAPRVRTAMTYHADLPREEEEEFLGIVSDPETVQGKRDVISRRKPSRLEMRVKVVTHLHDGTTPEVDLLRVPEGPGAPEDITSGVARLNRPLVQGSLAWQNSSQATRGSSRLSLTDGTVCVTQTSIEAEALRIKSGLTPDALVRS